MACTLLLVSNIALAQEPEPIKLANLFSWYPDLWTEEGLCGTQGRQGRESESASRESKRTGGEAEGERRIKRRDGP